MNNKLLEFFRERDNGSLTCRASEKNDLMDYLRSFYGVYDLSEIGVEIKPVYPRIGGQDPLLNITVETDSVKRVVLDYLLDKDHQDKTEKKEDYAKNRLKVKVEIAKNEFKIPMDAINLDDMTYNIKNAYMTIEFDIDRNSPSGVLVLHMPDGKTRMVRHGANKWILIKKIQKVDGPKYAFSYKDTSSEYVVKAVDFEII